MSSYFYGYYNESKILDKIKEKKYNKKYKDIIDKYYNLGNKFLGKYNFYNKLNRSEVNAYFWGDHNTLQFDIGWFNINKMYENITGYNAKEAHDKKIVCKQLQTEIEKIDKEFSKLSQDSNIKCLIQYEGISYYFKNYSESPINFENDYSETPSASIILKI